MATPTQLRSDVAVLTRAAESELAPLWAGAASALALEEALRDLLPALIDEYGAAASTLAADWYDDLRAAKRVRGPFRAIPADIPDTGAQALVGWALAKVAEPENVPAFRSLIEGGMQRRIAAFPRQTVMGSSIADPQAQGWQRQAFGSCSNGFCDMLAGRGAVYSEASADFAAHDNCRCVAVPAWSGQPKPVKAYTPTNRNIIDADRARVRDWIASH